MIKFQYKKQFLKDLSKLPRDYRTKIEFLVFEDLLKYDESSIKDTILKLKGYKEYYKFRVGEYRLGIFYDGKNLDFIRVLHRKEIYRFFP